MAKRPDQIEVRHNGRTVHFTPRQWAAIRGALVDFLAEASWGEGDEVPTISAAEKRTAAQALAKARKVGG